MIIYSHLVITKIIPLSVTSKYFSIYFRDSEANASGFLEDLEKYHMQQGQIFNHTTSYYPSPKVNNFYNDKYLYMLFFETTLNAYCILLLNSLNCVHHKTVANCATAVKSVKPLSLRFFFHYLTFHIYYNTTHVFHCITHFHIILLPQ